MFEYTKEGCSNAIAYLKSINKYYVVRRDCGYTIVSYANSLKKQEDWQSGNALAC